jgi:molybdopterin biosynthesis enzyme
MAAASETIQTIARLTPLAEVLALIDREVRPVAARSVELRLGTGRVLAADVTAPILPKSPIAMLDGWALAADTTLGAGGYSPVLLAAMPQRVEAGQTMPPGADCVAAFDAVKVTGGRAEALDTVSPGDGVLPAGADCDGKTPLRRAGDVLRSLDGAVFAAAGISHVSVRDPRIMVLPLREGDVIDAAVGLVGGDIESRGGAGHRADRGYTLATALATDNVDAIVAIGGTGQGRNDKSVQTLASKGRLVAHGIALSPGETAAFGFAGPRPVLLLPGRLDAALSVWLVAGRRMLARLTGGRDHETGTTATLARKITSTVGLAEVVAVRRSGDSVEPLATKYLSLSSLAGSDGWILVPADSEGYPAGSQVLVRPWP